MQSDRGQLLLVGSVAIAVVFLGLVVVLNAGLYTANVTPRGGLDSAADAGSAFDSARRDVGALVVASSARVADGRTYLTPSRLERNLTAYEEFYGAAVASSGTGGVAVTLNETTNGSRSLVAQETATRPFTSASGDDNWTVVTDADAVERFNITVRRFAVHDAQTSTSSVVVDDGTDEWRLETYWVASSSEAHVRVVGPSGVTDCTFPQADRVNESGVRVDLTRGRIDAPCADDSFQPPDDALSGDFDVRFVHEGPGGTERTTGTYGFVATGDPNAVELKTGVGPSPFVVPELAAATVDASFYSASVTATTTLTVTPGGGLPIALSSTPKGAFETTPGTVPAAGRYTTGLVPGDVTFATGASDRVATLAEDGQPVRTYNATGAAAVAPQRADFDGDGYPDAAFVDGSGGLALVDGNDPVPRSLASDASDGRFAVTDWNGSVSVFYVNGSATLVRLGPDEPASVVTSADAVSVAGAGDVDGDGDDELTFVGTDGDLHYLDTDGTVTDTGRGVASADAVGRPFDSDEDGCDEVPFVAGSEVALYDAGSGVTDGLSSTSGDVDTDASLGVLDVDLDGDAEVVYRDGSGELAAVDTGADATTGLVDEDGDPIAVDGEAGVA